MNVFDASALLCFLQGETGADLVEQHLDVQSVCSAANWSEVAQKVRAAGRSWPAARSLLLGFGLEVMPVTAEDAERAAELWSSSRGLSLGDRLCLAIGERLAATVWTADLAWGETSMIHQIR